MIVCILLNFLNVGIWMLRRSTMIERLQTLSIYLALSAIKKGGFFIVPIVNKAFYSSTSTRWAQITIHQWKNINLVTLTLPGKGALDIKIKELKYWKPYYNDWLIGCLLRFGAFENISLIKALNQYQLFALKSHNGQSFKLPMYDGKYLVSSE